VAHDFVAAGGDFDLLRCASRDCVVSFGGAVCQDRQPISSKPLVTTSPPDPTPYQRASKAGLQRYFCPKCESVVTLGESLCPGCGLKQR
jgi:hypothetical protein